MKSVSNRAGSSPGSDWHRPGPQAERDLEKHRTLPVHAGLAVAGSDKRRADSCRFSSFLCDVSFVRPGRRSSCAHARRARHGVCGATAPPPVAATLSARPAWRHDGCLLPRPRDLAVRRGRAALAVSPPMT